MRDMRGTESGTRYLPGHKPHPQSPQKQPGPVTGCGNGNKPRSRAPGAAWDRNGDGGVCTARRAGCSWGCLGDGNLRLGRLQPHRCPRPLHGHPLVTPWAPLTPGQLPPCCPSSALHGHPITPMAASCTPSTPGTSYKPLPQHSLFPLPQGPHITPQHSPFPAPQGSPITPQHSLLPLPQGRPCPLKPVPPCVLSPPHPEGPPGSPDSLHRHPWPRPFPFRTNAEAGVRPEATPSVPPDQWAWRGVAGPGPHVLAAAAGPRDGGGGRRRSPGPGQGPPGTAPATTTTPTPATATAQGPGALQEPAQGVRGKSAELGAGSPRHMLWPRGSLLRGWGPCGRSLIQDWGSSLSWGCSLPQTGRFKGPAMPSPERGAPGALRGAPRHSCRVLGGWLSPSTGTSQPHAQSRQQGFGDPPGPWAPLCPSPRFGCCCSLHPSCPDNPGARGNPQTPLGCSAPAAPVRLRECQAGRAGPRWGHQDPTGICCPWPP